ncbi:MAG: DUF4276 family protein [Elusimicrobia bacterium]|nr:DUF4276 family protein [Elusimicrobiota bacterium]
MKKVLLLVEGQTEENFIKKVLNPHLETKQIIAIPTLIFTSQLSTGQRYKGGYVRYAKIKKDIQNLLGDTSVACVSTMIDFYAMDSNFPGRANPQGQTAQEKAVFVEQEIANDINHPNLKPYISMHEFEALLFSESNILSEKLGVTPSKITNITDRYSSPEEINDSSTTSPSHRIEAIYPGYPKILFGYEISAEIGLPAIRSKCPHFDSWLTTLENL